MKNPLRDAKELFGEDINAYLKLNIGIYDGLIDKTLNEFWDWAECDFAEKDEFGDYIHYISKFLHSKLKERSRQIFSYLKQDINKRLNPVKLYLKYECFISLMWEDIDFMVYGVRHRSDIDGKLMGSPIPLWVRKGLSKEKIEDVKKSTTNMLGWGEMRNDMIYRMNEILLKKYDMSMDELYNKVEAIKKP
jgi:hypothetical protein